MARPDNKKEKEVFDAAFAASKKKDAKARTQDAMDAVDAFRDRKNSRADNIKTMIQKRHKKMKDET